MSGKENGVYIQKRTLIITICVALALNATSLFMGITIGRQQDKQQLPNDYNIPVSRQPQGEVASESDTLDQDLAYFPGMKMRAQDKLSIVRWAIERLADSFDVHCLIDQIRMMDPVLDAGFADRQTDSPDVLLSDGGQTRQPLTSHGVP